MASTQFKGNIEEPQERISSSDGQLMVIVAIGLDFFQGMIGLIPIIGLILSPLLSIFIFLFLWVWLKMHGVGIVDSVERIAIMFGGFLVELIPLLNILPVWTLMIFITVLLVRHSDKRKIDEFYRNANTSPQQT